MKLVYYYSMVMAFAGLLPACSSTDNPPGEDSISDSMAVVDSGNAEQLPWIEADPLCEIPYDTITDPDYNMHKVILDRYFVPGKRGYWMTATGDTQSTYLYHQDVHVWLDQLDTNEQGIYKLLTNKIAFLILAHDSRWLTYENANDFRRKYFLRHLNNPTCNEIPFDSLEAIVDRDMEDPKVWEGSMKQKIISAVATQ
jgi:hypothetical protein